jgi:transposase
VAELFGHSARTVQYWVRSFERGGFAGLREKPRHGRPPSLDEKTMLKVGEDLRRSPMDFGYVQNLWDGKLLSHHLAAHYGVHLGVRQCQRIFNQLESRRRKPRSLIAEADPKRHKKTDPSGKKR